jgi:multiple sugar transport system ATP-binding protein
MASVAIRKLGVSFGNLKVLRDLDLDVQEGEFIVLLGPSGCGKSTLLNAIAGLLDIDSGQVFIGGKNVTWKEPKDRGIGMVFQSYALYPRMTALGNMSFGLKISGVSRAEIARRVKEAAALLQIEPLLERRPSQLSGGQRQRVAIGRALVRDVDVFLFDEPLSNLDAALRTELRVELKRLHHRLGRATMIYVTHDQIEALTLADRIAVMHAGVIQQLDAPRNIYHKPANRFVAGFVGSPAMNFREGRLSVDGGTAMFEHPGLRQPLDGYEFARRPEAGRPVILGVRPEHVVVRAGNGGRHSAKAEMIEPMGAETVVWTSIAERPFAIRLDGDTTVRIGDELAIDFPAGRLNLFDLETGARL